MRKFEVGTFGVTRIKSATQNNMERIPDEVDDDLNTYDIWDDIQDAVKIGTTEAPMEISIREVVDPQKVYTFCNEILSGKSRPIGQLV